MSTAHLSAIDKRQRNLCIAFAKEIANADVGCAIDHRYAAQIRDAIIDYYRRRFLKMNVDPEMVTEAMNAYARAYRSAMHDAAEIRFRINPVVGITCDLCKKDVRADLITLESINHHCGGMEHEVAVERRMAEAKRRGRRS